MDLNNRCRCGSTQFLRKFDGHICAVCRTVHYKHPNSPVIDCEWEETEASITPQQRRYDLKKDSKRRVRAGISRNKI